MNMKPIMGAIVGSALVLAVVEQGEAADPLVWVPAAVPVEMLEPRVATSGLRLGAIDWHAQITGGVLYDDNISFSHTNRQADFIGTITPQLTAVMDRREEGYGTLLSLSYQPTVQLFDDHPSDDAIDHDVKAGYQWFGARLTLGVSQSYRQISGAVAEVGARVRQRTYDTELASKYAFSEKTSLELNPRLTIADNDTLTGWRDWGVDAFLNHALGAKLTGSLGVSGGYVDVDHDSGQQYVRLLARLEYAVSAKVDVTVSAGGEWRHYNGGAPDDLQPVFNLGAVYRPFDGTTLSLKGYRREEPSILTAGLNYVTTGFTAGIQQRIFERYFVGVEGSYYNQDYRTARSGIAAARQDDYGLVRVVAGAQWIERWKVSVFYQYQTNGSTDAAQSFFDNQVGLQSSWGF